MVKGVVVTGPFDRQGHRPSRPGLGGLRRNARQSALVARARISSPTSGTGTGRSASTCRRWPTAASAWSSFPAKGFLVAYIQYQSDRFLPAGVPNKRMPGAPADALDVHYDTVPFELFPSNFPAVKPIDIAPGTETITCDLTFDSGVVRTGTVRDQEGRPLSGTTMVGETLRNYYQFTSMDGPNFTVYGLFRDPKLYRTLIFRHAEKGLGKTLRIDGSDPGPIDVRLEPLASLTGRLVDASGKPQSEVDLQSTSDRRRAVRRRQRRILTSLASNNRPRRTVPHRRDHPGHRLLAPNIRGPGLQPRFLDAHGRRGQGSRRHHTQSRELIPGALDASQIATPECALAMGNLSPERKRPLEPSTGHPSNDRISANHCVRQMPAEYPPP